MPTIARLGNGTCLFSLHYPRGHWLPRLPTIHLLLSILTVTLPSRGEESAGTAFLETERRISSGPRRSESCDTVHSHSPALLKTPFRNCIWFFCSKLKKIKSIDFSLPSNVQLLGIQEVLWWKPGNLFLNYCKAEYSSFKTQHTPRSHAYHL